MSEAHTLDNTAVTEPDSSLRIGVLSFHTSKETKAILNAIRGLGHEPIWLREDNTATWIETGTIGFKPEVDVVLNRLLVTKAERPIEDLGIAMSYAAARPMLNPPESVLRAMHKYGAAAALVEAGVDVPDAYMAFSHTTINEDAQPLEGTAVYKPAIGTNGKRMSLLEVGSNPPPSIAKRRAFLQEFVANEAENTFDVRVYVVGGTIVAAMKRYAPDGEWRTNVSQGGQVEDMSHDLPAIAGDLAINATSTIGLDYAGVDLLVHEDEWYILEVNATAGFTGLYRATGISPAAHIARLAIKRGGGGYDDDRFDQLSSIFDDSMPLDVSSPAKQAQNHRRTIGYTERVQVGGETDVQWAIGKSDTGAKRTSVDMEVAARVGAGPIVGTTRIKSGTLSTAQTRPLVEVDVNVGDRWHTVTASIEDRSHMSYPILLGRDILKSYVVDIGRRVGEE